MRKKFLSLAVALACVVSAIPYTYSLAGTKQIEVTGTSASGTSDTSFKVTADMLGGGLLVTVPDRISLTYDGEHERFTKTSIVNAKGYIEVGKKLDVSVPTAITYTYEESVDKTADGTISFGTTSGSKQITSWSITELTSKSGNDIVGTNKNITVSVDDSEVEDVGIFDSLINFTISIANA